LGFLLITFFMLTTSMNKPKTMEINMPVKEPNEIDQTKVKASQAVTLLLTGNNKIVYYFVNAVTGNPETPLITDYDNTNGVRPMLLQENRKRNPVGVDSIPIYKDMFQKNKIKEDEMKHHIAAIKSYKDGLIVVIKADKNATYKNLVDILDEMLICNIGRYAIVDITDKENELITMANATKPATN